jgi:hypothetical protein
MTRGFSGVVDEWGGRGVLSIMNNIGSLLNSLRKDHWGYYLYRGWEVFYNKWESLPG